MKEEPNPQPDFASPLLHTAGTVGSDKRSIIVVFTTYTRDTTWPQSAAVITELCESLRPFVPGADPVLQEA